MIKTDYNKLNELAMEATGQCVIYNKTLNDIEYNLNLVCIFCKFRNHVLDKKCKKDCWNNRNLEIINKARQEIADLITKKLNEDDCLGIDCAWCMNVDCPKEKKGNTNE